MSGWYRSIMQDSLPSVKSCLKCSDSLDALARDRYNYMKARMWRTASEQKYIGRQLPKRNIRSRDASERTRSGNQRGKLSGIKADMKGRCCWHGRYRRCKTDERYRIPSNFMLAASVKWWAVLDIPITVALGWWAKPLCWLSLRH